MEYISVLDSPGFLLGNNSYESKIYGLSNINPHSTLIKFHQICGLFGLFVFFILVFYIYLKSNLLLGSLIFIYFLFEDYTPGTFGHIIILYFVCSLIFEIRKFKFSFFPLGSKNLNFERSICS